MLTTADGSTNVGKIVLQSLQEGYTATLVVSGVFTNNSNGQIEVDLPPGGPTQGRIVVPGALIGGGVSDGSGLPLLPEFQAALDDTSGTADPQVVAMAQTPGVNTGVIDAGSVGGAGGDNPVNGLLGALVNVGSILIAPSAFQQAMVNTLGNAIAGIPTLVKQFALTFYDIGQTDGWLVGMGAQAVFGTARRIGRIISRIWGWKVRGRLATTALTSGCRTC